MVKLKVLKSGSSGNSIFVQVNNTKILVDAGVSGKAIEKELNGIDVEPAEICAILVSHEHRDHVKGVGILSRRYDIPVYATERTWPKLVDFIGEIKHNNDKEIHKSGFEINDIFVSPFPLSHDAVDPVGFNLNIKNIKISIATDCGVFSSVMKDRLKDSNCLILESNHDPNMLKNGSYPSFLKKRVRGVKGHLSNDDLAEQLGEITSTKTNNIILAHLSEENNNPKLAYMSAKKALSSRGISINDTGLMVADRYSGSSLIHINH